VVRTLSACSHLQLMNGAIRQLQKTGYLDRLKAQWWEGRSECGRSGSAARISRMYGSVYISSASDSHPCCRRTQSHIQRLMLTSLVYLAALTTPLVVSVLRH